MHPQQAAVVERQTVHSALTWQRLDDGEVSFLPKACFRHELGAIYSTTPDAGLVVRFSDGAIYLLRAPDAIRKLARARHDAQIAQQVAGTARRSPAARRLALVGLILAAITAALWLWHADDDRATASPLTVSHEV